MSSKFRASWAAAASRARGRLTIRRRPSIARGGGRRATTRWRKRPTTSPTAFVPANCGVDGKVRDFVDTVSRTLPCDCSKEPWPIANSIGAQTYAEALQAANLVKTESDVGRSWCSLLTWPASLIAGAFSIFGFSNLGGAIGAGVGTVIGGIVGGLFGSVFGPLGAVIGALVGAFIGGIVGGAIGWAINGIVDWIGGLFSGPSATIWFTAFDGTDWVIPDVPVSQNGHSLTSEGPAMALFNGKLFLAYKGKDSDDLWFNTFDGQSWLANDLEITQNGHSKTDAGPALAAYNGKLYLAYKGSGSDDLWYNVFDGTSWLANDLEITQGGHSKTDAGPALAAYNGKLYLAYKGSGSDDLWYNVFDGTSWLRERSRDHPERALKDRRGAGARRVQRQALPRLQGLRQRRPLVQRVRRHLVAARTTSRSPRTDTRRRVGGPALAVYGSQLYLAYRGGDSDDIWYNVFDGNSWLAQDISVTQGGSVQTAQGPALAARGSYLFMAYRDNS